MKLEISLLRITVPLSFFILDCVELNNDLVARVQQLRDALAQNVVDENRDANKRSDCRYMFFENTEI